ncbi:filamentous hemagglutinin N-terminal domain-containing protein [Pseudomonas sp. FSL R10-0056]|uniref:two-partner secretion domain-containing protein n=1 Tax=unclassified Pseudomonas TaxID=196821 RepID=UPI001297EF89|nr:MULTISPECIES: hemagglutinin repeat-containing protein [unclassified Pseudomonas]MQT63648.1 filamentous hemagglutinin N-terminal domain-containing protein [Pseudomonas sp. FSL R10-0056]MQT67508.1 filamentous hemagglutinin N-terminal domain-containing protein [Pseudomonas sp. FSL R10-0071]MQU49720.1 filamentous hemagglutinin N-terminal domain-containing protein [Pseudomonas sp. FSL A6-1183]
MRSLFPVVPGSLAKLGLLSPETDRDDRHSAFLARQSSAALHAGESFLGMPKRGLAFILANALFWQPLLVQAEGIVVSGPGTSLGAAGNGVPIVNIAAPNGSGLSHNQFNDYNVGANGLILNNGIDRTQSTQLGGIILGNPNLQGNAAHIILNEVNGGSPSQLRGYTEVAGQSAKVIVANPYGITCNGCGFINTPSVTLSTGKPLFDNGRLDRYQVDGGTVTIDGQGLNASNIDRFDIITRSAKINAQINARHLTVIAGRNDVNARTLHATARADDGSAKPQLAIDSSALGGMYAGAIRLVGTEAGVGVKLDGTLAASGGDIQLDANGHLRMAQVTASSAITGKAGSLDAQEAIYAGSTLDMQAQGDLSSRKNLIARDSIKLSSGAQLTNRGIIEAGVNADHSRNSHGNVYIDAKTLANTNASIIASRHLTASAQILSNQGGTLSAKQAASIRADTLDNQNKGRTLSSASLDLKTDRLLNSQGLVSASSIDARIGSLDNRTGMLSSQGEMRLAVDGTLQNRSGVVIADGNASVTATRLDNSSGRISGKQNLKVQVQDLNNQQGQLIGQGAVQLSSNTLDNRHKGLVGGAQGLTLDVADIDNREGEVSSQAGLSLTGFRLDNTGGRLTSEKHSRLELSAGVANTLGLISSDGGLSLSATELSNHQGSISSAGQLAISSGGLNNEKGSLQGKAITLDLGTATGDLNNMGGLITTAGPLTLKHLRDLNNRGGEISTTQTLSLSVRNLDNTGGKLISNNLLVINGDNLLNQGGLISGWQGLNATGTTLDNRNSGKLSSLYGNLDAHLSSSLLNSGTGILVSQKNLTVTAANLDNSGQGNITSAGAQSLDVSGWLNNAEGGVIDSGAALYLSARDLDNSAGSIKGAAATTLDLPGTLTNTRGKLSSGGPLLIQRAAQIDNQGGELVSRSVLSLMSAGLDNRNRGTVAADGKLDISVSGLVQNSNDGLIYSQDGELKLTASRLDNAKGKVQGKTGLELDITENIDNQGGKLIAQNGDLAIKAANLENRGGELGSLKQALNARVVGVLRNGVAGIIQGQRLNLIAGSIDNVGGKISAQVGDALVTTDAFDNRGGNLYVKRLLTITGNAFDNSGETGGRVAAEHVSLDLSNALNNHKGLIESTGTLSVSAASVDNRTGQLRTLGTSGDTLLQIGGLLDNRNGTLESANTELTLLAGSFQNAGGKVLHSGSGTFAIDPSILDNVGGSLVSRGGLILNQDSWTNSSVIQAARLTVNVNSFNQVAGGQLLASNSFVGAGGNWSNNGLLASDGTLSINLEGTYSASGRLSSLGSLDLRAAQLHFSETATLAGGDGTRVTVAGQLNNAGRMTSATDLNLIANEVSNTGTLGAGANLMLTADTALNRDGLIFSGGDMQLLTTTFTNAYATVYGLGDVLIAKDTDHNQADLLDNRSGTVESAQNLSIRAMTVNNVRDVLEYTAQEKSSVTISELDCNLIPGAGCDFRRKGRRNGLWQIDETDRLNVTRSTAASLLGSGADLQIHAGTLNNHSSTIAATGNVTATAETLNNLGVQGQEITTTRTYWNYVTQIFAAIPAAANFNAKNSPTPSATVESDLSYFIGLLGGGKLSHTTRTQNIDGQAHDAVIQAGGDVNLSAGQSLNNSVIRPYYGYVAAGRTPTDTGAGSGYSTPIHINAQLPADVAQQQVNPVELPGFSLPEGQNGLFRLSGQGSSTVSAVHSPSLPVDLSGAAGSATAIDGLTINRVQGLPDTNVVTSPHKYLIETNPALTNLKQFMGSDYLLAKLGYDPDQSQKRLGDGFYEQRLIQQALTARTGQRFIDGRTSDAATFKYLMDNAVASKQALNLSVGITLTSEQIAALTHDIVWLESTTINNQQVLVPVLYMAQANKRLAPNGALIAGNNVNLITGQDLKNVGTLRATENLSANAGNHLINSGLIDAGNRLDLLTGNNLSNKAGGILAGRDISLTASKGDLLNERTVIRHNSSNGYRSERTDFMDSAARIEAANNLSLHAGRDVHSVGSVIKSGADTTIKAGRDVNLIATEQRNSQVAGTLSRGESVTQYGSVIEAGRDFQIVAARDISAIASQIAATRDLAMAASGDLTLASAANEQHSALNTKKVKTRDDRVSQVSSVVKAGGDVTLSAGQDMAVIGSRVEAGGEAYLVAGASLELKSAEELDYSFYSKSKKSSSGKSFRLNETDTLTNVGSLVTSGGNSTLVAGDDLLLQVSAVNAKQGAAKLLAGNNIQILAASDSSSVRHDNSQSKSSWGGLNSSKAKRQVSEASTTAVGSIVSGDTVNVAARRDVKVTGSALVSTDDLTVQAGRDLTVDAAINTFSRTEMRKEKKRDLTGVLTGNNLGLDDISGNLHLSNSGQKHNGTAQESTLQGSTLGSSVGDVTLTAGRELKVISSELVSTQDMGLSGSNVTIAAGTETAHQTTQDSSRSMGVGRVVGGMVVDTVTSIRNDVRASQQADDSRLKAVKGAQALLSAYNAACNMDASAANVSEGKPANSGGALIKIGTELGSTNKKSSSEYNAETARQSTLNSGGSLAIVATGNAPDTQGDIHVIGSSLKARDTLLRAEHDITLESAQDRKSWDNQSKNDKTSMGVSFNVGEQTGFTLDLGAQLAKGMGKGREVSQVNSTLDTGLLVLKSGQDTALAGAQVRADAIKADISGNLSMASRQDEARQKNRQTSAGVGGSICVPPFCVGAPVSASANIAGSKMNSDYQAVTDQTGLSAGTGGYDINVGKTTALLGAVIASDAPADKNHLSTDRLLVSDIKNKSAITSQAGSLSYSGALAGGGVDARSVAGGTLPVFLKDSEKSKTQSAISEGTITVRNPDGGNDLVGLNRDTVNANQHLDRPDEKAMQARIDLIQSSAQLSSSVINSVAKAKADAATKQANEATTPEQQQAAALALDDARSWQVGGDKRLMANIASGLIAAGLGGATGSTAVGVVANVSSSEIFKKIGDFATAQRDKSTDSAVKAAWDEGGAARVLLHALAGAAIGLSSGNAQAGALGAGASAALMPSVGQALKDSGLSRQEQDAIAALIATGVGASAGAGSGPGEAVVAGGAGFGVEAFNRQLHKQQEIPVLEKKAEELYKTLGAPRSSALWLDLLMIAAGGALDAADEARLSGLVAQSTGNDPQSRNFIDDLNIAKGIIGQLAAQKIPLKWGDGSQIVANGEKAFAFRATEKQFNDSTLFNASVLHGQGVVYEQWRQYGQEQTSAHSKEMGALSSTESGIKSATQRLSDLAGKGITTIAPELDAAMLLMPAGKGAKVVVEAVLAKLAAGKAAAGVGAKANVGSISHISGVNLPKSQSKMIANFETAGYPTKPVVSPTSGNVVGTQYILPDGSRVRVMQADGRSPRRASFENANGGPVDPTTGNPPQPPQGLSKAERKQWIRKRTHIEQVD